ncbi:DUF4105 domain-containing protein [Eudoraea sp.]|uniref:lipoprotein N-acyltransferase Lnb domain-containing protein n=1 Tax=Eudoraea sp. TaxID=1979955 RepID=UPI003C75A1C9
MRKISDFYLFFLNFVLVLLITGTSHAQEKELSQQAQISILTCGPGAELYSSFGHNAIRVEDPIKGKDEIYNYGTFNFNTPNFYYKFASGKLLYSLSVSDFKRFIYTYDLENRWVKEQILNLQQEEKEALYQFLQRNRLPENRDYKYDFLFDNCATKLPEVLKDVLQDRLHFSTDQITTHFTFRDLIHQNLYYNTWSSFGIDLALGSVIDREAQPLEYMFLPNYVRLQFDNSTLDKQAFVTKSKDILVYPETKNKTFFFLSPLFWLLLLFIATCLITYKDYQRKSRNRWFDFSLFLITGFAGLLIFFLWFLTDHSSTANNYNIFWALPFNFFVGFLLLKQKAITLWLRPYLIIAIVLIFIVLVLWISSIQVFSPLTSILLALLTIRYSYLYRFYTNKKAKTL